MPSIPSHGAAGGIPAGDKPPVGADDQGPPAPSHGAAGGYDIPVTFPIRFKPGAGKTGLTTNDPEFGR